MLNSQNASITSLAFATLLACAITLCFALCSCASQQKSSAPEKSEPLVASDVSKADLSSNSSSDRAPVQQAELEPTYPVGWLAVEAGGVPARERVSILHLPDFNIKAHRKGTAIGDDEQARLQETWPAVGGADAVVQYNDLIAVVPADFLLVNLPDVLPQAEYNVVYSYASTSRCAGQDIPGVTGTRLPGYADGRQDNPYWSAPRFVVPCAYRTACKAQSACNALAGRGLKLLVYDAYRPITAQMYLSDAFENAFWNNPIMQESLGDWSLEWYVASGASGHNYGTDLDVGVFDTEGNLLPMPSAFDAFDESGHLTVFPIDANEITPAVYRDEVTSNAACMALHEAFVQAGFAELASEWWHFTDEETAANMRSLVGDGGLDFMA